MRKDIVITTDHSELEDLWPVDKFNEIYPEESNFKRCAVITSFDEKKPEDVSLIVLRTFIEDTDRAREDQKYVVGIRFYSFGDMATIDVISTDRKNHYHMCYEHIKKHGWGMFDESGKPIDRKVDQTIRAPFLFSGGHLQIKDGGVSFFGESSDYGGYSFESNINSVASFVAEISGINTISEDKDEGELFVYKLLDLMKKHKGQPDFYEQVIKASYERKFPNNGKKSPYVFSSYQLESLITMKVEDRMIIEPEADPISIMIEERHVLSKTTMVYAAARKMRESTKEK